MGNFSGKLNPGNVGSFLGGIPQGMEEQQKLQHGDFSNQIMRSAATESNLGTHGNLQQANLLAPAAGQPQAQQSGGMFDPVRERIHSLLGAAQQRYQQVFSRGQQGQTNPAAAPSGRGPGPAAQQTTQAPGNAAMSRPQPTTSSGTAGPPGATGPMPLPDQDQVTGRDYPGAYAEGGAIPGRKLAGIRAKKAKAGNVAKATAGDKQVANQQPGAGGASMPGQQMPPRNTEPGAGISNQDPQLADGGPPSSDAGTVATAGMPRAEYNAVEADADGGPAGQGKFIQKAIKKPGQLHKDLGVPQGEKIPKSKIKAAEKGGGKVAQRARFADTLSKFKDGGAPKIPKLEPGAAPEPKPAPNAVEQTVNNDGMRHYLGKTIKRFDDGSPGGVKPDQVPTPAGTKDDSWPGLIPAVINSAKYYAGAVGAPLANASGRAGELIQQGLFGDKNAIGATPPPATPGKGASPPQDSTASAAAGPPTSAYNPHVPNSNGRSGSAPYNINDGSLDYPENERLPGDDYNKAGLAAALKGGQDTQGPPSPQGAPPAAGAAPIDFSQVQVDHSQIPTTTTEDWRKLEAASAYNYAAHGMGAGEAMRKANADITGMQHDNFMDYLRQGAALDAAGNKQGAMAAYKTAYQYFPTGHDMHFGVGQDGNIVAFGVNEQTGKPVQNGAVKLDQQGIHGIMTHFANPENFVNEGIRMQTLANETAHLGKGQIPLEQAQAQRTIAQRNYLQERNPTALAIAETRADAAGRRLQPDIQKYYSSNLKDLPNAGDAENIAAQLEAQAPGGVDQAHRLQILGIVRHLYDPATDPAERQQFLQKYHLQEPAQANLQGGAIPGRAEDPYARGYALYGQ